MDFSTYDRQLELQKAASASKTVEELATVMERTAGAFGFRDYIVMTLPDSSNIQLTPLIRMSSLPQGVFNAFDRHGLTPNPLTRRTLERSFAHTQWHIDDLPGPELPGSQRFRRLMRRKRLTTGVAFSFTMTSRERLGVFFLGDRELLNDNEQNEMLLIALKVCGCYEAIDRIATTALYKLSARELEVVGWSAEGKTSSEIASIIGLSDHTVNAYLANAIRKLDCVNRTQLVAKAVRLKLID